MFTPIALPNEAISKALFFPPQSRRFVCTSVPSGLSAYLGIRRHSLTRAEKQGH